MAYPRPTYDERTIPQSVTSSADVRALRERVESPRGRSTTWRGQPDRTCALPLLERALALRESRRVLPARLAETEFALARAVPVARGRELAERARARYAKAGRGFDRERQEAEAWLAVRR
jgi:hypothetical protein